MSTISIKNAKSKLKKYKRSKPEMLRLLWDIIVFRLVSYMLNMICLILLQLLYTISHIYVNFRINLTQIYIIFLRQEHQIEVLNVSLNAWNSHVHSYTPFHFPFTVPLTTFRIMIIKLPLMSIIWHAGKVSKQNNCPANFV